MRVAVVGDKSIAMPEGSLSDMKKSSGISSVDVPLMLLSEVCNANN